MKVAIHQPNFIPWIGYFHKIYHTDLFVFFDDVQLERGKSFTKRTKILIQNQDKWLTIPITNSSELKHINEAKVDTSFIWKKKHLKTIELSYKRHPFFDEVFSLIENCYQKQSSFLVDYNIPLIIVLTKYLNIGTRFHLSSSLNLNTKIQGADKILEITKTLNATNYISGIGSGSRRYINELDYEKNNIQLNWQKFHHPRYNQYNNVNFIPGLSIIDLLFNYGKESRKYLEDY